VVECLRELILGELADKNGQALELGDLKKAKKVVELVNLLKRQIIDTGWYS
jgi:hypothetical protein